MPTVGAICHIHFSLFQPIYLRVMLQCDRGIVDSCNSPFPCALCGPRVSSLSLPRPLLPRLPTDPDLLTKTKNVHITGSHPDRLPDLKRTRTGSLNEKILRIPDVEITSADYSSYDGIFVNDIDASLLSARPCLDPYTPESVDSHSPNVEGTSTGSDDLSTEIIDVLGPKIDLKTTAKLTRDRSVSPTQLKSRLDRLLNQDKVPELQRLNSRESCKSDGSKKGGLCCLALKCYGFCRRRARKVKCDCSCLKCCSS